MSKPKPKPVVKDPLVEYLRKIRSGMPGSRPGSVELFAEALHDLISSSKKLKGKTDLLSEFLLDPKAMLAIASLLSLFGIHGADKIMAIIQILQGTVLDIRESPSVTIGSGPL